MDVDRRYGPFLLRRDAAELVRDGVAVAIQPKAFDLLWLLVSRAGEVISHAELLASLWPDVFVSADTLAQMVRRVRRALGDHGDRIVSIPRRGYRAVPDPAPRAPSSPEAGLIGREDGVARLVAEAGSPGPLCLVGPAGIGKSALARATITRVGGVTVALAGLPDLDAAALATRRALGLGSPDGAPAWPHIGAALATRDPLLVLDGVDDLPVEGLVEALRALRAAAPNARVWATARRDLGIGRVLVIPPLSEEAATALFLARASVVEGSALPAIIRRLGGNPLAIELAAARTAVLSTDDLLARLDDPLLALGSPWRRAIEATFRSLTPSQLRSLALVSMFDGPFRVADAEARTDGDVIDDLQTLAQVGLVLRVDGGALLVNDTIRAHAREHAAASPEGPALLRSFARVSVAEAEAAAAAYDQEPTRERLAASTARVPMAWALALRLGDDDLGHRLRLVVATTLGVAGPIDPVPALLAPVLARGVPERAAQAAYELCRTAPEHAVAVVPEVLGRVGAALTPRARFALEAILENARSVAGTSSLAAIEALIARTSPDEDIKAWGLLELAWAREATQRGDVDAAERRLRVAYGRFLLPEAAGLRVTSLTFLGNVLRRQRRVEESLAAHDEALALVDQQGRDRIANKWRVNKANLLSYAGRHDEACALLEQVILRARGEWDRTAELAGLSNLAATLVVAGRVDEAEAPARRALALADGPLVGVRALHLYNLGSILRFRGKPASALPVLDAALAAAPAPPLAILVRAELASARADVGDVAGARDGLAGMPDDAWSRLAWAHVRLAEGDREGAAAEWRTARDAAPAHAGLREGLRAFERRLTDG